MKKLLTIALTSLSLSVFADTPSFKPQSQQALNNFAEVFIKKGVDDTLKGKNANPFILNVATAKKIIDDYKANQLKANKIYEGRYTRLQTKANRIDAGILNSPFIVAYGKNEFEDILIYIDPKDERFLDINAGDKIDLICKGKGYQLVSPAFNQCIFTKDYVEKAAPILLANIKKASDSNYQPQSFEEVKILLVYFILEPFLKQSCEVSAEQCLAKMNSKEAEAIKPEITPQIQAIGNYAKTSAPKSILHQL